MPLTAEQLNDQKVHFAKRTVQFAEAGYERFGAPEFILDQAGELAEPVLDVGTGTGITARALAGRGLEVVGVDSCADDLQVAAALTEDADIAGRIRYLVSDAARLPVPDGHFGSAVAVDFLHHLDAGEPVLRELVRVVEAGWPDRPRGLHRGGIRDGLANPRRGRARAPGGTGDRGRARGSSPRRAVEVSLASGHFHHVSVLRTPVSESAGATSPDKC